MKQYLEVGLLNNTHGVRGEMKLTLWCDDLDYLRRFQVLYLDPEGQHPLHVTVLRPQKQGAKSVLRRSPLLNRQRPSRARYCTATELTASCRRGAPIFRICWGVW